MNFLNSKDYNTVINPFFYFKTNLNAKNIVINIIKKKIRRNILCSEFFQKSNLKLLDGRFWLILSILSIFKCILAYTHLHKLHSCKNYFVFEKYLGFFLSRLRLFVNHFKKNIWYLNIFLFNIKK